ncbi:hypothetical protein [Bdellovibrio sp.]|uniref:hypothetical protein n=1 Tax=Bdellovibrio sp. TaxID=28201 RepID=UPI00322206F2
MATPNSLQLLNYPFSEQYRVSYAAKFGESEKSFKNREMTFSEVSNFLNTLDSRKIFLCEITSKDDLGEYAVLAEGKRNTTKRGIRRTEALSFLKQFTEDVVMHAISSTGHFEVFPHLKSDGSEFGILTQYGTRANDYLKSEGITLDEIGISNFRRGARGLDRDLPRYRYILKIDVCMIKHFNRD